MAVKVIGMVVLFFSCAGFGFSKSFGFLRRIRQLEAFTGAINQIANEIRYFSSPTEVIMEKIDGMEEYRNLKIFGICKEKMKETRDFYKAWESALRQVKPSLSLQEGDTETLLWFGRVLGTTDVEGELANCERYRVLLNQRLENAREDQKKRGKMYSSLGVLAGVLFVVILI